MPKLLLQTSPAVPVSKAPAPTTIGTLDTATGSQRISLGAQAKTLYRLVDAQSGLVPKNQKVLRAGKKLLVQIDGVTAVEIDNFFPENGTPASASADGAAYVVDTSATPTPAYGLVSAQSAMGPVADGNTLVWSQGMAAVPLPEGLGFASQAAAVASSSAIASGADGGALLGGLAAVAGGIAAAAGGKGAEAKPVPGKVAGSVFAGPVIGQGAVAGLKVEAFTDKGVSLGSTIVKADGTYELTLSAAYQGPLIIKIYDDPSDNITPKYLDEATQSAKTFDTPLLAIVNYSGSASQAQTINVTPLTTIAAVSLGISIDKPEFVGAVGAQISAQINQANILTAQKFALQVDDLCAAPIITSDKDSVNGYGRALALLSQLELSSGKSALEIINIVSNAISGRDVSSFPSLLSSLRSATILSLLNISDAELDNLIDNLSSTAVPRLVVSGNIANTSSDGSKILIHFDTPLAKNTAAASAFTVSVTTPASGSNAASTTTLAVKDIAVDGQDLVLTLTGKVLSGQTVSINYADPSPGNDLLALQSLTGLDIASFSGQTVNNLVSAVTPVIVLQANPVINYAENQAANGVLGRLTASANSAPSTKFRFADTQTATSKDGYFRIDKLGNISLTAIGLAAGKASNDFETKTASGGNSFTHPVQAGDDAGNWSDAVTLVLNISDVNDPPVRTGTDALAITVNEDSNNSTAIALGLSSYAYNPGGGSNEASQTLSFKVTSIPSFVTLWKADGVTPVTTSTTGLTQADIQGLKYKTVADGASATTGKLTWTVTDSGSGTNSITESLNITVNPINDKPVRLTGATIALTVDEDSAATAKPLGLAAYTYGPGGGADEAGQSLSYAITGIPSAITLYKANGTAVAVGANLTLAELQNLQYKTVSNANNSVAQTLSWTVTDNAGGTNSITETVSVTVTPVNDAPSRSGANAPAITVAEDSANTTAQSLGLSGYSYGPGGGADESGQSLSVKITAVPDTITLLKSGGSQVNAGDTLTVSELQGLQYKTIADANNSVAQNVSWTVTDNGTGPGTNSITETVSVTVTPVNDKPVRSGTTIALSVDEDSATNATSLGLAAYTYGPGGGADEAGQSLIVKITNIPDTITLYKADGTQVTTNSPSLSLADFKDLNYKTVANANNSAAQSLNWAVTDNGGGSEATLNESINVIVNPVNDQPVRSGANAPAITVAKDSANTTAQSLGLSGYTYGPGGGNDESGQSLSYAITQIPSSITLWKSGGTQQVLIGSSLSLADLQGLQYKTIADANNSVAQNVSWTVTDNGTGPGTNTITETVSVTVTPVNDKPVRSGANAPAITVAEDSANSTAQSLGLSGYSYGPGGGDDESSQSLIVKITNIPDTIALLKSGGSQVKAGDSLTVAELQGLQYKTLANANSSTAQALSWTVTDSGDGTNSITETVSVTVNPINDRPVALGPQSIILDAINEDEPNGPGATVDALFRASYDDSADNAGGSRANAFKGIAITGNGANPAQGKWQYQLSGAGWQDLPQDLSDTSATFLDTNSKLRFAPAANFNGTPGQLTVHLVDSSAIGLGTYAANADFGMATSGSSAGADALVLTTTVKAVNDKPERTGDNAPAIVVDEDSANDTAVSLGLSAYNYGPGGGDDESSQSLSVTITAVPDAITLLKADGSQVNAGNTLTVPELQGLQYKTLANANNSVAQNVSWTVTDSGDGTNSITETVSITVNPFNDAPRNTIPSTNAFFVEANVPTFDISDNKISYTPAHLNGLLVSDVDAGSDPIEVTLSVAHGSLRHSTDANLIFSGNDAASITVTGSQGDINAWLRTSGNLLYTPQVDYVGTETLTMVSNDQGHNGGDALSTTSSMTWQVADTTPPHLLAAQTDDVNGLTITLTYDQALSSGLIASDFTLSVTDSYTHQTVSGVQVTQAQVNGRVLTLTVSPAIQSQHVVKVTESGAIKDINTLAAADLSAYAVEVRVPDIVLPVVVANQAFANDENQASGAVIATVSASDNEGVTGYRFTTDGSSGSASSSDGYFSIDSSGRITISAAGQAAGANNFENALGINGATAKTSFSYQVQARDAAGNWSGPQSVTLNLQDAKEAPTLSAITTLTGFTEDTAKKITYNELRSAATGFADQDAGQTANLRFSIESVISGSLKYYGNDGQWYDVTETVTTLAAGGELQWTPDLNANGTGLQAFTVKAIDTDDLKSGTTVTVKADVAAVNDAPVASGSATLRSVLEDNANPTGDTIQNLFGGSFSDAIDGLNANSFVGIWVVNNPADATKGAWQWKAANGAWAAVPTDASDDNAIYLAASASLRFVPAANFNGAAPVLQAKLQEDSNADYNTWANGSRADTAAISGLSQSAVSLDTRIGATNDSPTVIADKTAVTLAPVAEDSTDPAGALVSALFTDSFSDAIDSVADGSPANTLQGIAITANAANAAQGKWQYQLSAPGSTWTDVPTSGLSDNSATYIAADSKLRFLPASNSFNGTPGPLTVHLIDSSASGLPSVLSGRDFKFSTPGGPGTANTVTLGTSVIAANDAPTVVANKASVSLTAIDEDTLSPAGDTVGALFSASFSDATDAVSGGSAANTFKGVAISDNAALANQGKWQYSVPSDSSWVDIPTTGLSATSALYLAADSKLRFVPALNFNGSPGALTAHVVDSSYVNGDNATAGVNLGIGTTTSAASAGTVSLGTTVNAVNDGPENTVPDSATPVQAHIATFALDDSQLPYTPVAITGLGVSDVDAGSSNILVTLSVTHGTLQHNSPSDISFTTNNAASIQATGSLAAINAWLGSPSGLGYTPNPGFTGQETLTMVSDDKGNTGSGGAKSAFNTLTWDVADSVAPVLLKAETDNVDGMTITLTYDQDLAATLDETSFSLAVKDRGMDIDVWVEQVAISGRTAVLTLTEAIQKQYTVTISYAQNDSSAVQDAFGNLASSVSNQPVSNRVPDLISPTISDQSFAYDENQANASVLGTVQASDNIGVTGYKFVGGQNDGASSPDGYFQIASDGKISLTSEGRTAGANNFENTLASGSAKTVFTYAVSAYDAAGKNSSANMTLTLGNVNDSPTLSRINKLAATEDQAQVITYADLVAASDAADQDAGDILSFVLKSVVSGTLRVWNGSAWAGVTPGSTTIGTGDKLQWTPAADVNGSAIAAFKVQAQDNHGASSGTDLTVTVNVAAVNDKPVAVGGSVSLSTIPEDSPGDAGTLVSTLFANSYSDAKDAQSANTGGSVASTLGGILVVGNSANAQSQGTWQWKAYGSNTWNAIATDADATKAYFFKPDTLLRFVPAANFNGNAPGLQARLIDDSYSGYASLQNGAKLPNVASDAITATTLSLGVTVNAANDAPTVTGSSAITLAPIDEDNRNPDGATVSALFATSFSDLLDAVTFGSSANQFAGIAITANNASAAQGTWQFQTNGGWADLPVGLSNDAALYLSASGKLRFVPASNYNGSPGGLSLRLVENSASAPADAASGSTVAISDLGTAATSTPLTLGTSVASINDRPIVLADKATVTLAAIVEGALDPAGSKVSALFNGSFSDAADGNTSLFKGIAISGVNSSADQGVWQYATNPRNGWTEIQANGDDTGLFLGANTFLRFMPSQDFNGQPGGLEVRLVESYTGATGIYIDLADSNNYVSDANNAVTLNTQVSSVNDAPQNVFPEQGILVEKNTPKFDVDGHAISYTPKALEGLSIQDVDAGDGEMSVTFSVGHGSLAHTAYAGLKFTDAADKTSVTVKGTLQDINRWLASADALSYTPNANYEGGDQLNMVTRDSGSVGDTTVLSDTDVVTLRVWDTVPPTLLKAETSTDGKQVILTYDEVLDSESLQSAASFSLSVHETDQTQDVTFESVSVQGRTLTLTLTIPLETQQVLTLYYNTDGIADDARVQDQGFVAAKATANYQVTNKVPDLIKPEIGRDNYSYYENDNSPSASAKVAGVDNVAVTKYRFVANGQAAGTTSPDGYFTLGDDGQLTLTQAAIAAGLNNAENTLGQNGSAKTAFNYTLQAGDAADLWSDPTAITVTINNVNEAPTVAALPQFTVDEDTPTNLVFTGTPFADVDSNNLTVTLRVASGTISATTSDGVTVEGSDTSRTFSGSVSALNAFFTKAGKITYTGAQNVNGDLALSITVDDGDEANSTASRTSTIHITAVNDGPKADDSERALPSISINSSGGNGSTIADLFGSNFDDSADNQSGTDNGSSANDLLGMVVIGLASTGGGAWQWWDSQAAAWVNVPQDAGTGHHYFYKADTLMRFAPNAGYFGAAPTLQVALVDDGRATDGSTVTSSWANNQNVAGSRAVYGDSFSVDLYVNEVAPIIVGSVVAGDVQGQAGASGMIVEAFDAQGVSLGKAYVAADGRYQLTLNQNGYRGPLILKVYDDPADGITPQYLDEATGRSKEFNTPLMAVVNYTGSADEPQTINATPLTTIAAFTAGVSADNPQITAPEGKTVAQVISESNIVVAQKFGLQTEDLSAAPIVTSDKDNVNDYGRALALVSQMEASSGKSTLEVMQSATAAAKGTDDDRTFAQLLDSAKNASSNMANFGQSELAALVGAISQSQAPALLANGGANTSSDGSKLFLHFDAPLSKNTAPVGAFTVKVTNADGQTAETLRVLSTSVDGSDIALTLSKKISAGQTVTVSYADSNGADNDLLALQSLNGTDVSSFADLSVSNLVAQTKPQIALQANTTISYAENQSTGNVLGSLHLVNGSDPATRYRFADTKTSTSSDGYFKLDNAGQISLTAIGLAAGKASNDFETKTSSGGNRFTHVVQAGDDAGNWSASVNVSLEVQNVNEAPVLRIEGNRLDYAENSGPVALFPSLSASDVDSNTYVVAEAIISQGFIPGQDSLSFVNDGRTMGNIVATPSADGDKVTLSSRNDAATKDEWQAALRAITYNNSSDNPDTGDRTIGVYLRDGNAQSQTATRTVAITKSNDAPTIAAQTGFSVTEESAGNLQFTGIPFADVDSDNLTVTLSVADGSIQATTDGGVSVAGSDTSRTFSGSVSALNAYFTTAGKITYTSAQDVNTARTLTITANDGANANNTASSTSTIQIAGVNDGPSITTPAGTLLGANSNVAYSIAGGFTIADVDAGSRPVQVNFQVLEGAATDGDVLDYGTLPAGVTLVDGTYGTSHVYSFQGTISALNAWMANAGFLKFTSTSAIDVTASIKTSVSDLGNTGTGGALTANGTSLNVNVVSDSTPPVFQNAVTNTTGDQITLTYNEALSATTAGTGAFAVSVAGSNRNVTGVSVSGSTVVLTLASAVTNGQTVTVGYSDPTANNDVNAVQDIAGNDAVTLAAATSVTNNVPDTTAPIRQSATTNSAGDQIILTYNEALSAYTAGPGDFLVKANGTNRTISNVSVAGSTVVLTLASPALMYGESVAVGYADPTGNNDVNAVQDLAGNDAATFSLVTVTNNVVDAIAPTFQSAATNQYGQIILTYNEALSATTAATTAFAVTVGGAPRTVSAAQVIGSTVLLTLSTAVASGDTVTVSYRDPSANNDSNAVQDSAGNDAVSLAATSVTNNVPDTTPPVFQSAATDNTGKIVLTYNEALSSMASGSSAFYVYLNGGVTNNPVTNVAVSGNTVILTLTTPIVYGNTATVQYVDSDGVNTVYATQDLAGNDAATMLSAANVVNNMPDTVPPVFQSAVTNTAGTQITLTYDENLSATTAATNAFSVSVDYVTDAVSGISVSGRTAVLTLATPVLNGQTVTVGYTDPTAANDANAIQDILGNDAVTLSASTSVANNVPDTTGPLLKAPVMDFANGGIQLRFNELLDPTAAANVENNITITADGVLQTGAYTVFANYSNDILALRHSAKSSNFNSYYQSIKISYTDPSAANDTVKVLQDAVGNDTASFNIILDRAAYFGSTVTGTSMTDYIMGGNNDDTIIGGQGNDTMWGYQNFDLGSAASDNDVFKWNSGDAGASGATDTIKDFTKWNGTSGDKLSIYGLLSGFTLASSPLEQWVKTIATGQTVNGVFNSTVMTIDVDGSGSGTVTQVIQFEGINLLSGVSGITLAQQLASLKTAGVFI